MRCARKFTGADIATARRLAMTTHVIGLRSREVTESATATPTMTRTMRGRPRGARSAARVRGGAEHRGGVGRLRGAAGRGGGTGENPSSHGEAARHRVEAADAGDTAVARLAVELQALDAAGQEGEALLQLGA